MRLRHPLPSAQIARLRLAAWRVSRSLCPLVRASLCHSPSHSRGVTLHAGTSAPVVAAAMPAGTQSARVCFPGGATSVTAARPIVEDTRDAPSWRCGKAHVRLLQNSKRSVDSNGVWQTEALEILPTVFPGQGCCVHGGHTRGTILRSVNPGCGSVPALCTFF